MPGSSIYKIPISFPGSVDSITVNTGGRNYSKNPLITLDGTGAGATAIAEVVAGVITKIRVTTTGQQYLSAPSVTITDPNGNGVDATATAVVNTGFANIAADTSILTNNIKFVSGDFTPGDSGLIRVWFCLKTAGDADTVITVSHDVTFAIPEKLNADQVFVIKSDGLYRFDIPVALGDEINIQSSIIINAIRLLRFDKIVIGA